MPTINLSHNMPHCWGGLITARAFCGGGYHFRAQDCRDMARRAWAGRGCHCHGRARAFTAGTRRGLSLAETRPGLLLPGWERLFLLLHPVFFFCLIHWLILTFAPSHTNNRSESHTLNYLKTNNNLS